MEKLNKDNYIKPDQTFTDRLTREEMNKLLEDYTKENIKNIARGSHVRYFTKDKDGNLKFRLGGTLISNDGLPDYVILSNGKQNWSVQIKETIFYVQISNKQLKAEFNDLIFKKDNELKSYADSNKSLMNDKKKLEKIIAKKDKEIDELQTKYNILKKNLSKQKK